MFSRVLFFVFKQKTAYEMRISDWSSDVCSSDLSLLTAIGRDCVGALQFLTADDDDHYHHPAVDTGGDDDDDGGGDDADSGDRARHGDITVEIGRASWRERVCPDL